MWRPQLGGQIAAIEARWVDVLALAGERGGGKSAFQCGYQEDGALRYGRAHRGAMFRKTYPELEQLQLECMRIFPEHGATFHAQPSAAFPVSNCWYWPNGAQVRMRYIENDQDYLRYHGHQFTAISLDEVTEYATPDPLLMLISTLRSPYDVPCTARLTGNPGGIGHVWMRSMFKISSLPERTPFQDPDSGLTFMFVRSILAENQGLKNHEQYVRNLMLATRGNEPLRRAWMKGDWNVVAGAFFSEWDEDIHVLKAFMPPPHWPRFTSSDWGSAKPFSTGWYAICPDALFWKNARGEKMYVPRGAIVRYRELYGCDETKHNVGVKWSVPKWAKRVVELSENEKIEYHAADPAMFSEDGGPSLAEQAWRDGKLPLTKADNKRIPGWNQVRYRLDHSESSPMAFVTENCMHFRRTVPALQHDKLKLEDVDTDGEDHVGDEFRYACMSRPILRSSEKSVPEKWGSQLTYDQLIKLSEQNERARSKYRA
jgi:hypothetical protein